MVVWALWVIVACQQRVLKTFPGSGYLRFEVEVVWLWCFLVNLYMYTYTYTYMHMYMNLFSKIICLNLMTKLSNKFLELQLEPSSLLHTPVSIRIKQRLISLRPKIFNHLFDCAVLTVSFLYGRMEKQTLKGLWRNWTNFYLTLGLRMNHHRKK